jgi:hypothetical protein
MKLVISTIVVGIILFLLGGLFYSFLFAEYFKTNFGHMMRSETDFKMWAFAVGSLFRALFMYIIYSIGYKGGSPFMEGAKFGIIIGFFVSIPYVFFMWGSSPVKYQPVVLDGVLMMVTMLIGGIVTGLIHGKKAVQ